MAIARLDTHPALRPVAALLRGLSGERLRQAVAVACRFGLETVSVPAQETAREAVERLETGAPLTALLTDVLRSHAEALACDYEERVRAAEEGGGAGGAAAAARREAQALFQQARVLDALVLAGLEEDARDAALETVYEVMMAHRAEDGGLTAPQRELLRRLEARARLR